MNTVFLRKIDNLARFTKKLKKYKSKIFSLNFFLLVLIGIALFLSGVLANKLIILQAEKNLQNQQIAKQKNLEITLKKIQDQVIEKNYVFKIKWGDLGKKMVEDGVIDKVKLSQAVAGKNELPKDLEKYFSDSQDQIELTQANSQFWVDVLWGLGLANKNRILEEGDMMRDGDASNFASTGGWTLGQSDSAMNYYSKYSYINLSEKQQKTVEEIAGNIYRPCCGNSTAFPDCNHGMAMLGLIELMVSQEKSRDEIYKTALAFNTYWFPQTYLETAFFLDKNGQDYSKTSPKELLSQKFSSAMRDEAISKAVQDVQWEVLRNGGSCGA